jgi:hypothetical protein
MKLNHPNSVADLLVLGNSYRGFRSIFDNISNTRQLFLVFDVNKERGLASKIIRLEDYLRMIGVSLEE